jgi:hypothetical protein
MGKMKALLIDREEDNCEFDALMEEAHYEHTINDFVSLIQVYGWSKVTDDLRAKMGELKW